MDEFQKQMYDVFAFETNTFLDQIETILMQAEQSEGDIAESVPEIFRIMHTLKSSSAMMGFGDMSKLCHGMENLFHFIRDEHPANLDTKKITDLVLKYADYVKRNMQPEANEDPSAMLAEIAAYLDKLKNAANGTDKEADSQAPVLNPAESSSAHNGETLLAVFVPDCKMISLRAYEIMTKLSKTMPKITFVPDENAADGEALLIAKGLQILLAKDSDKAEVIRIVSASPFIANVVDESSAADPVPTPAPTPAPAPEPTPTPTPTPKTPAIQERRQDRSRSGSNMISVQTEKLDDIVNIAGELVIASMGAEHIRSSGTPEQMVQSLETLHTMILSMQDMALGLRMFSLKDLFHQMHRLVRSTAGQIGREIHFHMSGEDTELDKKIIENMMSPLQHLLRNAVDHGIESPEERLLAGKPPEGAIYLSAKIEGGQAILAVRDDGRGLSREKIIAKAVQVGLLTQKQTQGMTDEAVFRLIMLPGFSTNKEITELSGRGVGMDVVNEAVRKLSGRIDIHSEAGKGTTFLLQLPLTLTVAKVLLITAGNLITAIPMTSVAEIFAASPEMISRVNGVDTVLFSEKPYTVISIEDIFSVPRTPYDEGVMLLINAGNEQYVLHVTTVIEEKSVVVKPIPKLFANNDDLYGTTILGDGSVSLIMDATGIYKTFLRRGTHE